MKDLICGCFGRRPPNPPEIPTLQMRELLKGAQTREQDLAGDSASVAFQALSELRARLACTNPQSWLAKLTEGAMLIADTCDAGLTSLLGLTASGGQASLVVLATGGPAAASLAIGEILPWDPHSTGGSTNPAAPMPGGGLTAQACKWPLCYTGANTSAVSLPPWEPPPCLQTVTPNVSSTATGKEAQDGMAPTSTPQLQKPAISSMPKCLFQSNGSVITTAPVATAAGPNVPSVSLEPWARVLVALQRALPASGPARWHVVLLPLSLQDRQVGALLLALPVVITGGCAGVAATVSLHDVNGGGNGSQKQQSPVLRSSSMTATAGVLQKGLLQHGTLMAALGQCVAECCLAPVLPAVEQVCTSCALLNSCTTLQELSTCLTTTLATTLTSDLHVELMVRLALLPSRDAPQGLLLEDHTHMHGTTSTGCTATTPSGANAHVVSTPSRSAAVSFLAVHRASGHQHQHQHQPVSPRGHIRGPMASGPAGYSARTCGAMPSLGSGIGSGALSSRVPLLQAEAARTVLESGGPVSSDDVLCAVPLTHGTVHAGQTGTTIPGGSSSNSMKRGITGAIGSVFASASAGANRRLQSPSQSSSSRGQVRATPMSMTSTLAAALLSETAAAAANDNASSNDTGGGRISNTPPKMSHVGIGGGSTAAVATGVANTVRLVGAVISNVHSYLQDMEQPTADVFLLLRRYGANPISASLIAIAAWSAARSSGGVGAGVHPGTSIDPVLEAKLSFRTQLADSLSSHAGIEGGAGVGGNTSVISCTGSMQMGPWDGSMASNPNISPPAFIMYLTSAMPLPPQLLGAVRERAMALLEVLLPAAARALSSAVYDEWFFVCTQVVGGGLANPPSVTGAVSEMPRSCSLVVADRAIGNGLTAPLHGDAALFASGGRTKMGAASSALGPNRTGPTSAAAATAARGAGSHTTSASASVIGTSQPLLSSRSTHGMLLSGTAARGTGGCGVLAGISPVRTCGGDSSRAGDPALQLLPSSPARSAVIGTVTREDVSSRGVRRAHEPPSPAALRVPPSGRGSQRLSTAVSSGLLGSPARQRSQLENCHPLEAFASSSCLLALEEDDGACSGPDEGSGGGESGGDGTDGGANTLLLNTVLSIGGDTDKAARQAQLDIMVSTYHNTLSKARHEAGALGGLHAEDDVRNLRLIKTIGTGGCSVVLLARLHAMPVAVKVILPPAEDSADTGNEDAGASGQDGRLGGRGDKVADEHEQHDDDADVVLLPPSASLPSSPFTTAGGSKPPEALAALETVSRARTSARQVQMRLLMRGARELAVMTSISHPNIVQVYSYCTRVLVQETSSGLPKLEVLEEGSLSEDPICTALIMEYCDMGSLADAIDSGAFARATRCAAALHAAGKSRAAPSTPVGQPDRNALGCVVASSGGSDFRSGSIVRAAPMVSVEAAATAGTPSMRAIYLTLLEVALALRHLHSLSLVHSDVKPANVLLRSSAIDPRGFTAKLTDFGFVNLIEQRQSCCGLGLGHAAAFKDNSSSSGRKAGGRIKFAEAVGTVTHMAPELFIQGHPVDSGIDIYAFGILMWELNTGRAPYPEYAEKQFLEVPFKVVQEGLRPRFPPDTPLHFKLLAQECWAAQPGRRPTAAELVSRLQRLLDLSCGINTDRKVDDARGFVGRGGGG